MSQPALTKRLQQLEHELDTVIVYRNVKGVQFTPEGEYIVQYAMRSLEEYKELRRALLGLHERQETTITIASAGSLSHEILPELFQKFGEVHPDVHPILYAIAAENPRSVFITDRLTLPSSAATSRGFLSRILSVRNT